MSIYKIGKKHYVSVIDHKRARHRFPAFESQRLTEDFEKQLKALISYRSSNQFIPIELNQWIDGLSAEFTQRFAAWGLIDSSKLASQQDINVLLAEWQKQFENKERSTQHIQQEVTKVKRMFELCGFNGILDINAEKIADVLKELRETGYKLKLKEPKIISGKKVYSKKVKVTKATCNHYRKSMVTFVNWLLKTDRLDKNPLKTLDRLHLTEQDVSKRRAITLEEVGRLLDAALNGLPYQGISGYDRYLIYKTALSTGMRAGELKKILVSDIDRLGHTIRLRADITKNKTARVIPLTEDLFELIQAYTRLKHPTAKVFE